MRTQPAPATDLDDDDVRGTAVPGWTARRGWALRMVVPILAVVVLAAIQPAIVTGTLGSPQALLIVVGVFAATIGWAAVLRRVVRGEALRTVLVLVPVAVILGLYVAPYFGPDEVVDEAFPVALAPAAAGPPQQAAPTMAVPASSPAEDVGQPAAGAEAQATPGAVVQPPPSTTDPARTPPEAPTTPTAPTPAAPTPAAPVELSRGSFVGLDDHSATGQAAIYQLEDGSRVVRLEDVDLQRVPDAHVYIVPGAEATSPTEGAVTLGPLTGNVGSSNYPVPADVDLAGPITILVWCEPFASPVGAASQA